MRVCTDGQMQTGFIICTLLVVMYWILVDVLI